MAGVFEILASEDFQDRSNFRKGVAVSYKRAHTRFSNFLMSADNKDDFEGRLDLINDDLDETVKDTLADLSLTDDIAIEEFGDPEKVVASVRDRLTAKGGFCDECRHWKSGPRAGCTCGDDTTDSEADGDSDNAQDLLDEPPSGVDKASANKEAGPMVDALGQIPGRAMGDPQQQQLPNNPVIQAEAEQMLKNPTWNPGGNSPFQNQETVTPGGQPAANPVAPAAQQATQVGRGVGLQNNPNVIEKEYLNQQHAQGKNPMSFMGSESTGLSDEPSPKMDKKRWKPNALNPEGNLKPIETDKGTRWPSEDQDVTEPADHKKDFLEQSSAGHTKQEDLPSDPGYDGAGFNTDKNQKQYPTKTFGDEHGVTDPVTRTPLA